MKIAVCTTFPNEQFDVCAKEMLETFHKYWPEDIKIFIQVDEQGQDSFNDLNNNILAAVGTRAEAGEVSDRCYISAAWHDEQKKFMNQFKDHKPKSYKENIVGFSHKVFALEKCADAIKDDVDYIIWLDADVITKSEVTYDWLKSVLPEDGQVVSYLHRGGLHSECGFVAYNMRHGGYELLHQMKNEYILGGVLEYKNGLTDCHVLDFCLRGKKFKDLYPEYEYGVSDINVWPNSKLAEKMEHRKGNRKFTASGKKKRKEEMPGNVISADNLQIKTKNCLDNGKIVANVKENLSQIRAWATICRPTEKDNYGIGTMQQEIIMCSAGPSLVNHIDEIKKLQTAGAKVVCVKHAIDALKMHGVKPWAVVLLDPRAHVEGFIKDPDPEVIYFVASMCDPSVVKTLNDNRCRVIGYHAFVNAGEIDLMIPSDLPVSGGSGTATRSIGLFSDMFGFKKFHLFGYDLCHYQKPDLTEKNPDGNLKYMEISIGTHSHKNKQVTRTFWTEGQLLAQSNELKGLYKDRPEISIEVYGDGMAGWIFKHHKMYKAYQKSYNENLERKREGTPTIDAYVATVTRGSDLSRGV